VRRDMTPRKRQRAKSKAKIKAKKEERRIIWTQCKWCGRQKRKFDESKKSTGPLCTRCRNREEKKLGPPKKIDALEKRLPGSFESGKRR